MNESDLSSVTHSKQYLDNHIAHLIHKSKQPRKKWSEYEETHKDTLEELGSSNTTLSKRTLEYRAQLDRDRAERLKKAQKRNKKSKKKKKKKKSKRKSADSDNNNNDEDEEKEVKQKKRKKE